MNMLPTGNSLHPFATNLTCDCLRETVKPGTKKGGVEGKSISRGGLYKL